MYCTIYAVHCNTVHCTLYSILYNSCCTLQHGTLYTVIVYCTIYAVHCNTAHCTLYSVLYTLCCTLQHGTLYTVQCKALDKKGSGWLRDYDSSRWIKILQLILPSFWKSNFYHKYDCECFFTCVIIFSEGDKFRVKSVAANKRNSIIVWFICCTVPFCLTESLLYSLL